MAEEARRPGDPISPRQIGIETANAIGTLQGTNYSSLSEISLNALGMNIGLGALTSADPTEGYLTQVRDILLPMTIATCDADNNRVQFTLLVNPESINHGKTNSVYASYSRKGYVTQVWGPNQDLLTGNGKTAAFFTPELGLTNKGAQRSFGFQNFMMFFSAYRNNGYAFADPVAIQGTLTRVIDVIHGIEISYDGQIFMGHFNNFTIDEAAETPYILNYNFEFVCSTLTPTYNEVRGHFIPIPAVKNDSDYVPPPKILSDIDYSPVEEPSFRWG